MRCPKCGSKHLILPDYQNWYIIAFFYLITALWSSNIFLIGFGSFMLMVIGRIEKKQMLCLDCGVVATPEKSKEQKGIAKMNRY
jgi:hypothetical protein